MFRIGRRLFSVASIGLLVVAALHTVEHFAPEPPDLAGRALVAAMKAHHIPVGLGMSPSIHDVLQSLSLTMGIALLYLGLQNLVVARAADTSDGLVRRLSWVSVLGVGALVALFGYYRVAPPMVTLGAVDALFLLALLVPSRPNA